MTDIHTLDQVAEALRLSRRRVRALAAQRNLGRKLGRVWLFTDTELTDMRTRQQRWNTKRDNGAYK